MFNKSVKRWTSSGLLFSSPKLESKSWKQSILVTNAASATTFWMSIHLRSSTIFRSLRMKFLSTSNSHLSTLRATPFESKSHWRLRVKIQASTMRDTALTLMLSTVVVYQFLEIQPANGCSFLTLSSTSWRNMCASFFWQKSCWQFLTSIGCIGIGNSAAV